MRFYNLDDSELLDNLNTIMSSEDAMLFMAFNSNTENLISIPKEFLLRDFYNCSTILEQLDSVKDCDSSCKILYIDNNFDLQNINTLLSKYNIKIILNVDNSNINGFDLFGFHPPITVKLYCNKYSIGDWISP